MILCRMVPNVDGGVYGGRDKTTGAWRGLVGMLHREVTLGSMGTLRFTA